MNRNTDLTLQLTGKTKKHTILIKKLGIWVHKDVKEDLLSLISFAKKEGLKIVVISSFRSFQAQCFIWNQKAIGKRPLLDIHGNLMNIKKMSKKEVLFSILAWSALPGASRHHWGTDFDIVEGNAMPKNYKIQLTPVEVQNDGIFGPFHQWFDEKLDKNETFGFLY
jgi:LAS superfamily LD-carboxypeptidase LdcB